MGSGVLLALQLEGYFFLHIVPETVQQFQDLGFSAFL